MPLCKRASSRLSHPTGHTFKKKTPPPNLQLQFRLMSCSYEFNCVMFRFQLWVWFGLVHLSSVGLFIGFGFSSLSLSLVGFQFW